VYFAPQERKVASTTVLATVVLEGAMDDVDVWYSIRFFLMIVAGLTAIGIAFFAVA
jgi:hypothetical protein